MKITLHIDQRFEEPEVILQAPQKTEEIEQIVNFVQELGQDKRLTVKKDEEVYRIEAQEFDRIYIENRKVWLEQGKDRYASSLRLYEVLELLPSPFLQISQSEIINTHRIHHLQQTPNGLVQIFMKNGAETYSSRRYLKHIKEKLSL